MVQGMDIVGVDPNAGEPYQLENLFHQPLV